MKNEKNNQMVGRRRFIKAAGIGLAAGMTGFPNILTNSVKPVFAFPQADLPKREVGKTGMKVTVISLGSHVNPENVRNPEGRVTQLQAAVDMGINLFDIYEHTYHQFENTSKVLIPVRKDVHISLAWVAIGENEKREMSPQLVRDVVENALRTFKTDYIDMYRVVNKNSEVHRDMFMKLKEEGKIRAIGYAAHYEDELIEAIKFYNPDFVFMPFNPIMNKEKYVKLMPLLKEKNVALIAMKPFTSGSVFKLKKSSPMLKNVEFKEGYSIAQAILKYIASQKEVTCTVPAMNTIDEIKENLNVLNDLTMDWFEKNMLKEARHEALRIGPSYLPPHYRWLHEEWIA